MRYSETAMARSVSVSIGANPSGVSVCVPVPYVAWPVTTIPAYLKFRFSFL